MAYAARACSPDDERLACLVTLYPPYHPVMMTALLLYGYSRGVYSSRRLERACEERLDFRR